MEDISKIEMEKTESDQITEVVDKLNLKDPNRLIEKIQEVISETDAKGESEEPVEEPVEE